MAEICVVLAPGQNHFFVEVGDALKLELEQLGVAVEVSRDGFPPLRDDLAYVLVSPHEFRGFAPPSHWPTPRQLERTVLYCLEQPGTKFFDSNVEMGTGPVGAVMDINPVATAEQRRRGVPAHHAPLGWTRAWTFADPTAGDPRERDVDVVHLGIRIPRRGAALAHAADRLARRRTALLLGDDHGPNSRGQANFVIEDDKWDLLARSRILLNIHVGDRPYFEWLRVVQAICNGVFVVSEHSDGTDPLNPGEDFASGALDELGAIADAYLEEESLRAAAAVTAFEHLRDRQPFRRSAELLAELAADLVARVPATQPTSRSESAVAWPDNSGIRAELAPADDGEHAGAGPAPDFRGGETTLLEAPGIELLGNGRAKLAAALDGDPSAAFAWGLVARGAELRNVFPWQPWRLAHGSHVERPALWRQPALTELTLDAADEGHPPLHDADLYRRAARRGWHGIHVPEIVATEAEPARIARSRHISTRSSDG